VGMVYYNKIEKKMGEWLAPILKRLQT